MPASNDTPDQDAPHSALRRAFASIRWRRSSNPKKTHSELATAVLGVSLGLTCALFPWYVFYNPDQFGIRAMKFSGGTMTASGPTAMQDMPDKIGLPMSPEDMPQLPLDPFATGTLPFPGRDERPEIVDVVDQPFPAEVIPYRMVHATLGRAMIEDDGGLFVVQPGSVLPDSSRVTAIEQQNGEWVMLTSNEKVLRVDP